MPVVTVVGVEHLKNLTGAMFFLILGMKYGG